jgi:hypothetical protein
MNESFKCSSTAADNNCIPERADTAQCFHKWCLCSSLLSDVRVSLSSSVYVLPDYEKINRCVLFHESNTKQNRKIAVEKRAKTIHYSTGQMPRNGPRTVDLRTWYSSFIMPNPAEDYYLTRLTKPTNFCGRLSRVIVSSQERGNEQTRKLQIGQQEIIGQS